MYTKYFSYAQKHHKSSIDQCYASINFDGSDFIDTANAATEELASILSQDKEIALSQPSLLTLSNELICSHN